MGPKYKCSFFVLIQCLSDMMGQGLEQPSSVTIIGGSNAKKNEFPYVVSIRRTEMEEILYGHHICSGTLIDGNTVVTAAHCVFDQFGNYLGMPDTFTIVAGTIYRTKVDGTEIIRTSKEIIVHPTFKLDDLSNNVAVIFLNAPIQLDGKSTKAAPLAKHGFLERTKCMISGWGICDVSKENFLVPEILKKAEIYISPREECIANYTKQKNTTDDSLCAGVTAAEVGTFQGDSGSPLICNNHIYGITSKCYDCAVPEFPAHYTDVTKHIEFIRAPKEFIRKNSGIPLQELQSMTLLTSCVIILNLT